MMHFGCLPVSGRWGNLMQKMQGHSVKTQVLVEQQQMTHINQRGKKVSPLDQLFPVPLEMVVEKEGKNC